MSAKMSDEKTDLEQPATLQVSGEGEVKLDSPPEEKEPSIHTQTPEDRDPGRINDYVKVQFHEIFAEPDTEVYSFDKIWRLSFTVFTQTKIWCYRITSVVLAIPLAVMWGCYFACLSFCTFWCCIPCLRCKEIELDCFKKFWTLCCDSTLGPCYDAIGRIFSNIRVHQSKD